MGFYVGECGPSATGPFTQVYVGTKASFIATDLAAGTLNWFRMAAIGAAGQSDWSEVVSKRAA